MKQIKNSLFAGTLVILLLTGCNGNSSSISTSNTGTSSVTSTITDTSISESTTQNDSNTSIEEDKYYTVSTHNFEGRFESGYQFNQSSDPADQNQGNVDEFVEYMNEGFATKDFIQTMETSKAQIGVFKDESDFCLQLGSGKADGSVLFKLNYEIKRVVVSAYNYSKGSYSLDTNSELEIGSSSENVTNYDLKSDKLVNVIADLSFEKPVNTLYMATNGYSKYGAAGRVSIEYITFYY